MEHLKSIILSEKLVSKGSISFIWHLWKEKTQAIDTELIVTNDNHSVAPKGNHMGIYETDNL